MNYLVLLQDEDFGIIATAWSWMNELTVPALKDALERMVPTSKIGIGGGNIMDPAEMWNDIDKEDLVRAVNLENLGKTFRLGSGEHVTPSYLTVIKQGVDRTLEG